jgi:hypothetical protein
MKRLLYTLAAISLFTSDSTAQISQAFKNVTVLDTLKTSSDSILPVKAHLVPTSDSSLDLGSAVLKWRTIYADNTSVVASSSDTLTAANLYTKGVTWTARASATEANDWRSVAYGNGVFVSLSFNGTNRVQISYDGVSWIPVVSAVADAQTWRAITYGNGMFVAVSGTPGTGVMTSTNGTTWVARTGLSGDWRDITYGEGLFVAVSFSGTSSTRIMTSQDAVTWTYRTSASTSSLRSVTYGGGVFVVGSNADMLSSEDGVSWTIRTTGQANFWQRIAYGNGVFVAVSFDGTNRVQTSVDGTSWVVRNAAEQNDWESVVYADGLFIAVASTGTNRVMTSPDGIFWTARSAATANAWRGAAYGNGVVVAVANSGTNRVMTSSVSDFNLIPTANAAGRIQQNGPTEFTDTAVFRSVILGHTPVSTATSDSLVVKDDTTGLLKVIAAPLSGSATLDFPNTNTANSADLTITVAGAADGDVVSLGVPNGSTDANSCFTAWVSAANTVTVRFNNYSGGAIDPASGTFKVKVLR